MVPEFRRGIYGVALEGVGTHNLLVDVPATWETVRVVRGAHGSGVHLPLGAVGALWVDVDALTVTAALDPEVTDEQVVHPILTGAVAALAPRWRRQAVHGAGVVVGGRGWGVIGERGAGKSTTVAALAQAGSPVLADDLLVIGGGVLFAGPRCLDLRDDAAARVGGTRLLGSPGALIQTYGRRRWRLPLPPVPAEVPFGGWLFLEWSDGGIEVVEADVGERLRRVVPQRRAEGAADATGVLDLVERRGWVLRRPRDWGATDEVCAAIEATLGR